MQLRKNPPFEINADDPFQDDRLEHKPTIELLSRLIQSTEQPFVMTVEAPWGWGKTKFIERWKAHLSKEGHVCLYFNAWENDFVSDPLYAFIGELNPIVEAAKGGMDDNSPVKKGFARLKHLGVGLAKKSAPILVKAAVSKALGNEAVKEISSAVADSAEKVAESLSVAVKNQIENYEEEKKGIRKFRETLKELALNVTEEEGKPKQLVFFVDELDRCRPDFAMTLLERIKHLFNVDRIVFVLAIDPEQLRNTVRYLYGSGDNAEAYLRRFIDFSFQLPKPSGDAFADLLYSRFHLADFFSGRQDGQTESQRFLSGFVDTSKWLDLDLRTQEQCFTRLNAIFHLIPKTTFIPTNALCVIVGLRVGRPGIFEELKKVPSQKYVPKSEEKRYSKEFSNLVDATFISFFMTEETLDQEIRSTKGQKQNERDQERFYSLQRRLQLLEHLRVHRRSFLQLIEFSGRFV